MEYLKILALSLGSLLWLFVLTKLMGNKQLSQLNMFDYIIGISIGSIAAEMATSLEDDFLEPLIAMTVFALVAFCVSVITDHSVKLRAAINGVPLILFEKGGFIKESFKKSKIDVNEFLSQARSQGHFDLDSISTAVLETNGKISFLLNAEDKPATVSDLSLKAQSESYEYNVVVDGHILPENLRQTGCDEKWLTKQLGELFNVTVGEIFLATCDNNHLLKVYKIIER